MHRVDAVGTSIFELDSGGCGDRGGGLTGAQQRARDDRVRPQRAELSAESLRRFAALRV